MADNLNATNKRLAEIRDLQEELNRYVGAYVNQIDESNKAREEEKQLLKETNAELEKQGKIEEQKRKKLERTRSILKAIYDETVKVTGGISGMWKYLNDADASGKSLARSLGLNAAMSNSMNASLRGAASYAAQMGVSFQDLAKAQASFTEQTGTMALLSIKSLEQMSEVAGATGLSMEQSAKFAGQLNSAGVGAGKVSSVIEKTMKSGQTMGLSLAQTLKTMTENMSMMNKYNFQSGVDGFRQMAQFAQQQRISVDGIAASMDKFNTLEGSIDASARLYAMGGEFANADAFSLGFNARNNPEVFAKQMNDMMKGLAVQDAKGIFKVSAVDMDRLRVVSEITGQSVENLKEQAIKLSQQQFIGKNLLGNLSEKDREFVSNIATQSENGNFTVSLNGEMLDVSKITTTQLGLLKEQTKTLEEQARVSQTWNEQLNNSVNSLKAQFLPLLNVVNKYLGMLNTWGSGLLATMGKVVALAAPIVAGKAILGGVSSFIGDKVQSSLEGRYGLGKKGTASIGSSAGESMSSLGKGANSIPEGSALQSKAAGIAAIGVAAAGIGAGIWMAADGASRLAKSLEKLNPEQLSALGTTMMIVGGTMVGVMAAGIYAIGAAGQSAALGLIALGGAAVLVGGGIWLATNGISAMVESLGKAAGVGANLAELGKGMLMLSSPTNLLGIGTLASLGGVLSASASGFNSAGTMFKNVGEFMSKPTNNLIELQNTIKALKEFDGNSMLNNTITELKNILNKGLEVRFADKEVNITTKVDLYIDKEKLATSLQIGQRSIVEMMKARKGTDSAVRR